MGGEGKEETQLVILKTAGWRPPAGLCLPPPPPTPALKAWSELLPGGERPKLGLGGSGKGFRDDPRGRTSQAAAQGPGSLERDLEAPAVAGYMDEKVHRKRTGVEAGRSSDMVPQDPSWEILWVQWDLTACRVKHPWKGLPWRYSG